ncbi:transposase [uncultured Gammaproteobacteria bacterium]
MTDHDGTYHQIYTDPLMVADLLVHFVNESWVEELDFARMQRVNTKFHLRFLPKREGDVVWQIPTRSGAMVYLLVLLEFQSTVNRMMAVRIVAYANLLWLQLVHEKKLSPDGLLPPIFPVVLYNGAQPWPAPVRLRDLIGLPEGSSLWKFQPDGQFFLIDQGRLPPDLLEQMEAVSALLFRIDQCKDPEILPRLAEELFQMITRHPEFEKVARVLIDMLWYAMVTLTGESAARENFPKNLMEVQIMLQENMKAWRAKQQQEWFQTGEASVLTRQLQRRFGNLPAWANEKIARADPASLEEWTLRILDAPTLESVLADLS